MGLQVEEEGYFNGYDGNELFFRTWPHDSPKAVILGIHGLGEHSGCYKLLAEGLQNSPFQLVVSDLRGHGRSEGKRGIGTIDEFVLDIKLFVEVVKSRFKNLPLFFLGHSMGGLVLSKLLIKNGDFGAVGAIFSSPLLGVVVDIPAIKRKSANVLAKVAPNITFYNEIPLSHLTHNKNVVKVYENDHWRHDRISPRLFSEMLSSMDYVMQRADKIQLPVLMQLSGDDLVVNRHKGEEFFGKIGSKDKDQIVYEGYYHEIYNEIWREKPYEDLLKWLGSHMAEKK
jgi:alpha-beta hydrolase superfamily lysophospholipase